MVKLCSFTRAQNISTTLSVVMRLRTAKKCLHLFVTTSDFLFELYIVFAADFYFLLLLTCQCKTIITKNTTCIANHFAGTKSQIVLESEQIDVIETKHCSHRDADIISAANRFAKQANDSEVAQFHQIFCNKFIIVLGFFAPRWRSEPWL